MLDGLGDPSSLVAADVGAGTGISARLLADRGVRVIAVEPNDTMRNGREPPRPPQDRPGGTGPLRRPGLDDDGVDLVLCAQSYHWFDPTGACAEFGRVLKSGRPIGVDVERWG